MVTTFFLCLIFVSCYPKRSSSITPGTIANPEKFLNDFPGSTNKIESFATQHPAKTIQPQKAEVNNISVSLDGNLLALSASSGVRIYNLIGEDITYYLDEEVLRQYQGIYSNIA
jgi:hypothetical protein